MVGLSKKQKANMNKASELLNATERYPNTRMGSGVSNRSDQIMTWRLPNGATIQMYINPSNFVISKTKHINQVRTKGGFVVQYWGANLDKISLSGTTGSSGIRGINVLNDIYQAENRAFEVVAGAQTNELFNALESGSTTDRSVGSDLVPQVAKKLIERNFILRPSLGSLALGIVLYYQGVQYKGFFTDFSITESVGKLGLFDYQLNFMVTETRGVRENFMAWHREPLANDQAGQLVNASLNAAGNALRNWAGLDSQPNTPLEFHPESAPLTFGGNSVASMFGVEATGIGQLDMEEEGAAELEIIPSEITLGPGESITFRGRGGSGDYRFLLAENNSGAIFNRVSGTYTAGSSPSENQSRNTPGFVTDIVRLIDSENNFRQATISIPFDETYNTNDGSGSIPSAITVVSGREYTFDFSNVSGTSIGGATVSIAGEFPDDFVGTSSRIEGDNLIFIANPTGGDFESPQHFDILISATDTNIGGAKNFNVTVWVIKEEDLEESHSSESGFPPSKITVQVGDVYQYNFDPSQYSVESVEYVDDSKFLNSNLGIQSVDNWFSYSPTEYESSYDEVEELINVVVFDMAQGKTRDILITFTVPKPN
jgi:hypothetical protein